MGRGDALALAAFLEAKGPVPAVVEGAGRVRDEAWGNVVTYSPKVFVPLTKLCRDVCHYCTFARPPDRGAPAYLTIEEVLAIARAGAEAGCLEALFTLGDKPELRYPQARAELQALGHATTIGYLAEAAALVLAETGLLPHANPGVMGAADVELLRRTAPSMGLMLESTSERLGGKGEAHHGSPDKQPARRLATIDQAGRQRVPFTTGLLIGIGETWAERAETLLKIQESHDRWGHVQEVIVQNFRAKPGTPMHGHPEPGVDEMVATLALARLVLGPDISVQAPPNLAGSSSGAGDEGSGGDGTGGDGAGEQGDADEVLFRYLAAGINDWGGVSPVTIDHVNPERPWPALDRLRSVTESAGFVLAPRLTVYPRYAFDPAWVDPKVRPRVLALANGQGLGRETDWYAGDANPAPLLLRPPALAANDHAVNVPLTGGPSANGSVAGVRQRPAFERAIARVHEGEELSEDEITLLFSARGPELDSLAVAADDLRRRTNGDEVTFVVNRNINYTNMCYFRCGFCAFSKGPKSLNLRGDPYLLSLEEIAGRTVEAWERGATEVCMQGGIHPSFTGDFYVEVLRAVKQAVPDIHIHAFSPLEVWQGAETKGVSIRDFLWELKDNGLSTLPGTAAEILDDEVRKVLCPDKVNTAQWSTVARTAHSLDLRMTTTIMFGHLDSYRSWARHLVVLRDIQKETGGFTEFVPLPFVHMAAPVYLKGKSRRGPTFAEAVKMHAVGRLALHPWITNVQASWVKLGTDGAQVALQAGCNDLGGTLMNESISRAAGASHGQEVTPDQMKRLAAEINRPWARRTTLYKILERGPRSPSATPATPSGRIPGPTTR
ncbi:MAG TPA: 5-amino-6-(D-ribitylamino)uracil--L-tyrosine 4-hydroxyphenyl transferase CofH [Actinomycetota bacterium]